MMHIVRGLMLIKKNIKTLKIKILDSEMQGTNKWRDSWKCSKPSTISNSKPRASNSWKIKIYTIQTYVILSRDALYTD